MYKLQIVRDQANQRAWDFLLANDTELKTSPLYIPLKTLLDNKMNLIVVAKQKQFEQTGYITGDKGYHKNLVGETIWKFANRGSSQAFVLNKPDLAAALDKPLGFILRGKGGDVLGKATDLYNLMKQNESILTEIKVADFTEMEDVLKDYNDILNAPKEEIKEKKTEGTDPIPGLLDEVDVIKNHIGKMIQSYFAHLYSKWVEIIKVGSPMGVRKLVLVALFTDETTKVELRRIKVTMAKGENTFVKYSSKKGYVRFYSLENGNYALTAEHNEYKTFSKADIGIDENHIEKLEVKLQLNEVSDSDTDTTTGILSLIVYDKETGEPLAGVINSIPALNHSNTTDEDGEDYADGADPGDYQGTLFCEGKKPLNYTFTSEAGKTTTLKLYMEKETE
jgi:hypothetical protein